MTLKEIQLWIIEDQYSYGEWGKNEVKNPTDENRTFEISRLKPNLFSSSQAFYALKSTGFNDVTYEEKFFTWVNKIRNSDGFWTSATGAQVPFGSSRGFSEVINIRHTAKGLDLLLLTKEFRSIDTTIFEKILDCQNSNGSFPQHESGDADIWTTAYVINLLIRSINNDNVQLTRPRNISLKEWSSTLKNKLDKSLIWLLDHRNSNGLWELNKRDPYWISEAVLLEIGAYIGHTQRDIGERFGEIMLSKSDRRQSVMLWDMLLMFNCLRSDQQKETLNRILSLEMNIEHIQDMIEATSFCKLIWLKNNIQLIEYYRAITGGHESLLFTNDKWNDDLYFKWCIEKVSTYPASLTIPINKYDAWNNTYFLLQTFKYQIEYNRGWQLLWKDSTQKKDENIAQIAFWNIVKPICSNSNMLIREPETGRGPVDFEYSNKFRESVLIEFKLANSDKLKRGFNLQVEEYLKGKKLDSAFVVVVGFSDDDEKIMLEVEAIIENHKVRNPKIFFGSLFINAKRRIGASKD